ncbi:hypothetical protein F0L74_26410 [Chitinophaga agrisoli]|uniref:Uncharacterized protein n=1 Tax=Chitinophaga agrisoli TaxID=2607653 RepID=A0A5B2VLZ8_9BACT|nr:hypothetical protein [Chitinophaga agrisoli]KAA2239728.1 hypothetical protein F0L74_26410 [Chitinophaga agrisoli]
MNILTIADGFVGLFPKKISVTLIHETEGRLVGTYKMSRESLPEAFNRPTVVTIDGQYWRVTRAEPFHSNVYAKKKKLVLHVEDVAKFKAVNNKLMVPTIANPPAVVPVFPLPHDLTLTITAEAWRQIEFLPLVLVDDVEKERDIVEELKVAVPGDNGLRGYDAVHVRREFDVLDISFEAFYELVQGMEKGNLQWEDKGMVVDGFYVRSARGWVYYGVVVEERIQRLGMLEFDSLEEEVKEVLDGFELVLVDWCGGRVV